MKLFIDPGHGGLDPGAKANGLQEKDMTLTIALKLKSLLAEKYSGHTSMLSRQNDQTVSLTERTKMANNWKADYLISIHINAGGGRGFESYIYNGSYPGKTETERLRAGIHDEVIKQTSLHDRGKKAANFHMLRESKMPAILTENGFIDTSRDAFLLKQDDFLEKIARGHAYGLATLFQLPPKTKFNRSILYYRVITGSFTVKQHARKRLEDLKEKGFSSFIERMDQNGVPYYRVITGSFQQKSNAKRRISLLKQEGFEAFLTITKQKRKEKA